MIAFLRRHLARRARATVAVEMALISVFFLLPLIGGAVDFVIIMPAQAQLNTALQALYYYALTNPANATSASNTGKIIAKINTASFNQISMPATLSLNGTSAANPVATYVCYITLTSSNVTSATPSFSTPSTTNSCTSTQTAMTFVNYKVTTTVSLPMPLPGIGRSWTLSASGSIQTN